MRLKTASLAFATLTALFVLSGCMETPRTSYSAPEQIQPAEAYIAVVTNKIHKEETVTETYNPALPLPMRLQKIKVPEKFLLDLRYCEDKRNDPRQCSTAQPDVPKEIYDKVTSGDEVFYKNGKVELIK